MHRLRAACDALVRDAPQFRANGFILIRRRSDAPDEISPTFVNAEPPREFTRVTRLALLPDNKELYPLADFHCARPSLATFARERISVDTWNGRQVPRPFFFIYFSFLFSVIPLAKSFSFIGSVGFLEG